MERLLTKVKRGLVLAACAHYFRPMFGDQLKRARCSTDCGLGLAFGPFGEPDSRVSDREIRIALAGGNGPSLLREGGWAMEEVRCWRGHVRADYLIASEGSLSIVEIKSDADTLRRLDEQIRVYNAIADRVTVVVGWMLVAAALHVVPWWWEVWLAERPPSAETRLVLLRDGAVNPDVNAFGLASMLPVKEARKIAADAGLCIGESRSRELRQSLAESLTSEELRSAVSNWLIRLSQHRTAEMSSTSTATGCQNLGNDFQE